MQNPAVRFPLLLAIVLVGCSGNAPIPVTGQLMLTDETPVPGATLNFEDSVNHVSASGVTDEQGKFRLTTNKPGDGALAGTYRVTVHPPMPQDSSQEQEKPIFHARYQNPTTSQLEFKIDRQTKPLRIELDKP